MEDLLVSCILFKIFQPPSGMAKTLAWRSADDHIRGTPDIVQYSSRL
jgi:hypothetical protein